MIVMPWQGFACVPSSLKVTSTSWVRPWRSVEKETRGVLYGACLEVASVFSLGIFICAVNWCEM